MSDFLKNAQTFVKVGVVLGLTVLVILSPWGLVWSMNTLFPLTIPYTFKTWLASTVLLMWVNTGYFSSKSKKD